jgi:hypothetical protein
MHDHTFRSEDRTGTGKENGGRRLEEEERLFGARGVELDDMVGIVAAYAHNLCLSEGALEGALEGACEEEKTTEVKKE